MKHKEKKTLFREFQYDWREQLDKISYILKYISTYPEVLEKLNDFHPIGINELSNSQLEWGALVAQFENPIETNFFNEYWVPIQKDGYAYFIDISSDSFPIFEVHYFPFEPYRWHKKYVFKDLSQFLINLDNPKFSVENHFEHRANERWSEVQGFFHERDRLGFEGKLELDPIERDDIFSEGQNSDFIFKGNSITLRGINSIIIGLLPYDYKITLHTFNAPHKQIKNVSDNVKNIRALVYLIQSAGMLSIDSYSISFDSENTCRAEFADNIFTIQHMDTEFLSGLIEKYEHLRTND